MKDLKIYEGSRIRIKAFQRGGYFILRISNLTSYRAATRKKGVYVDETSWTAEYDKKFEDKDSANRYFLGIKRNNPDLKLVKVHENSYISYEGIIEEF